MTVDFIQLETLIPSYKKMIGSDSIESDVYGGIPEVDYLEWGDNTVSKLITATQKVHKVVVLPVKEYRAQAPRGFMAVIQAAYRMYPEKKCTRRQITQWTQDILDGSGCKIKIDLECPRCTLVECNCESPMVTVDVNEVFRASHPENYYGYMSHFLGYGNLDGEKEWTCKYTNEFKLMRATNHALAHLPFHIGECVNINAPSAIEYSVHPVGTNGYQISTTFKEGEILLVYVSEAVDSDGYRLVPNTGRSIEAVLAGIDERVAFRHWRRTHNPHDRVDWQILKADMEQKIGRAVSELKMPDKDKWVNFLNTHWKQLIPYWSYDPNRNLYNPERRDPGRYWGSIRPDYNFGY